MNLTAAYVEVPEGYIGFVEELPGANTQGATLEEVRENLQEAAQMVLDANREFGRKIPDGSKGDERAAGVGGAMKRQELVRHLEAHGCYLLREGGRHSIFM